MEIGTKPIPISVLTAVTNLALNAASVFPSRRIEISDSHTDLNRSPIFRLDAALQDFEVSAASGLRTQNFEIKRKNPLRDAFPLVSLWAAPWIRGTRPIRCRDFTRGIARKANHVQSPVMPGARHDLDRALFRSAVEQ
jgi:hypothetical protein